MGKGGFQLGGGLHKPCNLAVDLLPEGHVFRAKVWVITVATGRLTGGFVNAALVWLLGFLCLSLLDEALAAAINPRP